MVIKSPFRDYYDFVAHQYGGGDPRIVYPRQRIIPLPETCIYMEVENFLLRDPSRDWFYKLKNKKKMNYMYLVIAGKAYLLGKPAPETGTKIDISTWKSDYDLASYQLQPLEQKWEQANRWLFEVNSNKYGIEFGKEHQFLVDLCRKINAPVFVISRVEYTNKPQVARVTICGQCPVLSRLGIPALISAQQIYQDLAMFVGNKMKDPPDTQPPVALSNKSKIVKAGFDLIQSFRHRV
jgi:hypothetical protein